jgi:hypothetical protein
MTDKGFSIIVDVPTAEKTCFVVMPFHEKFDALWNDIDRAARDAGLTPNRTKDRPYISFLWDIDSMLHSAQLVIAVCLPDSRHNGINPNVLYELGKAHALAKPTIIIAAPDSDMPSDFRDKYYISYEKGDFRTSLTHKIRETLNRTGGLPVDPNWKPPALYIQPSYRMCIVPEFFDSFTAVIDLGDKIHMAFQGAEFYVEQITRLSEQINILQPRYEEKLLQSFQESWSKYITVTSGLRERVFGSSDQGRHSLRDRVLSVRKSLQILLELVSRETPVHRQRIEDGLYASRDLLGYIDDWLNKIVDSHAMLLSAVGDRPIIEEYSKRDWEAILQNSAKTKLACTKLVNWSHQVIRGMVDVFHVAEKHA